MHNIKMGFLVVLAAAAFGCKKDDKDAATSTSPVIEDGTNTDSTDNSNTENDATKVVVAGTISLTTSLAEDATVTHVVARSTSDDSTATIAVDSDGKFELPIDRGQNFVLTYVDATKTGSAMLVSTFKSGELDTLVTSDTSENVALGTIDVSSAEAAAEITSDQLLESIDMPSELADVYGQSDDVSLRYVNPDIDGDGKLDADNGQSFNLDFHNRFSVTDANNNGASMNSIKNAFPPDDARVSFMGSGIIPWFEATMYAETPDAYSWTFTNDVTLNETCTGFASGAVLPAGTACHRTLSGGGQSVADRPSIELKAAVDGTYTMTAGGKTFTWTNVKVSDFSGGEGFLALFPRFDVDDDNKLRGVSWRWRRKASDGTWAVPTAAEIQLLIKDGSAGIGLTVDGTGSNKGIAVKPGFDPDGSVTFATATFNVEGNGTTVEGAQVSLAGMTEAEVKDGVAWTRVLENPGISYDDKLGMRFFFGFYGQNN